MLEATCHCGAVKLQVQVAPDYLIDCNCSICRRNGALWALYDAASVEVKSNPSASVAYVWGAGTIRTMHCKVCGCTTHWEPIGANPDRRWGVNARNFAPLAIAGIKVRKFDGADTWAYVD